MRSDVFKRLLHRPADSHKYQFGHVLVVGGSPGTVGAPFLAGMAALRTGAGLVTIASQKQVVDKLEQRVEEITTLALPSASASDTIGTFIRERKVSVVVIGPGMTGQWANLTRKLLAQLSVPLVIDGGGLSALREHLEILAASHSNGIVLTPHLGEFQRFYTQKLPTNRLDLKPVAEAFARDNQVTLVLKGNHTYVTHPDGTLYENSTGGPGLATAGTGDVLAGVIGGIIAQGIEPGKAAEAAVHLHGLAGDIAVRSKTQPGVIASDVIEALPAALQTLG